MLQPDDQLLSTHFYLSELTVSQEAARRGLRNVPNGSQLANLRRVVTSLEVVRQALGGAPILISSGFRCPQVNALVGGAQPSAHVDGCAADFTAPSFGTPRQVCHRIIDAGIAFDQLIFEGAWVHFGIAPAGQAPHGQVLTAIFIQGHEPRYIPGVLS